MKIVLLVVCILGFISAANARSIVLDERTFKYSVEPDHEAITLFKTKVTFKETSPYPNRVFDCRLSWVYGLNLVVCDIPDNTEGWYYNSYDAIFEHPALFVLLLVINMLNGTVLPFLLIFLALTGSLFSFAVIGYGITCGLVGYSLWLIYRIGLRPYILEAQKMFKIVYDLHIPSNLFKEVLKFMIQTSIDKGIVPGAFQFLLEHSSPEIAHWNSSRSLLTYAIQAERFDLTQKLLDVGYAPTFYDLELAVLHDDIGSASKIIPLLDLSQGVQHPFTLIVSEQMQYTFPSTLSKGASELGFFVTNKK